MSVSDPSSVVAVERTAVPVDPLWPPVVQGRCTWCGDLESEHEGGVREHHRIEVLGGRYDDEPEVVRPGLPAPVDPEAPGVTDTDLVAVIAARLAGCVTPTASGWVKLAAVAVGEQLVLTVTRGPLPAGMPTRVVDRTVLLGEGTVVSRDERGARPGTLGPEVAREPDPDSIGRRVVGVLREGDPEPTEGTLLLWADGTLLPYRRGESCVDWSRFVRAWARSWSCPRSGRCSRRLSIRRGPRDGLRPGWARPRRRAGGRPHRGC